MIWNLFNKKTQLVHDAENEREDERNGWVLFNQVEWVVFTRCFLVRSLPLASTLSTGKLRSLASQSSPWIFVHYWWKSGLTIFCMDFCCWPWKCCGEKTLQKPGEPFPLGLLEIGVWTVVWWLRIRHFYASKLPARRPNSMNNYGNFAHRTCGGGKFHEFHGPVTWLGGFFWMLEIWWKQQPGIILNEIGSLAMKPKMEGQKLKQLQVDSLMELAFMRVESYVKGIVESDKLQYYYSIACLEVKLFWFELKASV